MLNYWCQSVFLLNKKSKKNNWISFESNPYIEYQKDVNKFRCSECKKEFQGKAAAARHSNAIHKITIDGEKYNSEKNQSDENNEHELNENISNEFKSDSNVEQLVFENMNREFARGGAEIAQNTDFRFIYEKTKTLWPIEWDFGMWISALVTYALNEFGISAGAWQDKSSLSPDKIKFIEQVKQDWYSLSYHS